MTTLSARLGLKRHTTADRFHIQDYADNWAILDNYPGALICTSTSRPTTWGVGQAGLRINETDTNLIWRWTGTAFVRQTGSGLLGRATVTSDTATTSFSPVTAVSLTQAIPDGQRPLQISVSAGGVYSTGGVTRLAVMRGSTVLTTWLHQGAVGSAAAQQPQPLAMTLFDTPNVASATYSLAMNAEAGFGGTCTISASLSSPLALSVVEL